MSMSLLEIDNLTKTFGGLYAVKQFNLKVFEGEIVSIIGPNGSGKTTLFNLITGLYHPDEGEIYFEEMSLVGQKPDMITRRGITRTFQTLRIFSNMSVLENALVGMHTKLKSGVFASTLRLPWMLNEEREARKRAEEVLSIFGNRLIGTRLDHPASSLSYANRRRLEICRALVSKPKIVLLDEPAAGMNPAETIEIMGQIKEIRNKGYNIILIEHDMKVVMGASDRVIAMDHGEKIAEGTPDEVASNPQVIEAYLGRKESVGA